jgi:integrase
MTALYCPLEHLPARAFTQGAQSRSAHVRGLRAELPAPARLRRCPPQDRAVEDRARAARRAADPGLPRSPGEEAGQLGAHAQYRLAAINSFFRFLDYRMCPCLDQARRIHALPKTDQALVGYLARGELQALLDAPDAITVSGIRDRAMLHLAFAAGMRVSELVGLNSPLEPVRLAR